MFATADFNFDLITHPYQLITRHCTSSEQEWDKYHAHPGMEFIFVHQGSGSVIVDQNIYSFGPGTLMYFQPFQLHQVKAELKSGYYVRSKTLFEPSLIYPFLGSFVSLQHFYRYLWEGQLTHQVVQVPGYTSEFEALFSLYPRIQPVTAGSLEGFGLFIAVFFQLVKNCWQTATDTTSVQTKLRHIHYAEHIMRWINVHFRKEFSLSKLADELHLSNYHISHLFKKATGSTITEYLISRRLREACVLLTSTQLSIQTISQEVGISNFSYFCRLFKTKYNMTPAQYRSRTLKH